MTPKEPRHIVADGQRRIWESEGYREHEREIRGAVVRKYQTELASAGRLRRAIARLRMRWEIREELRRLAPDDALYAQNAKPHVAGRADRLQQRQGASMVKSKAWDWDIIEPIWAEPSPEVYALAVRWRRANRSRVLDLGCGPGRNALFLAGVGFAVQALDLSPTGIAKLKASAEEHNLPIGITLADMLALPYAALSFDALLAFHTIYHTDRTGIEAIMAEIGRVLAHDGEVYITFNSKSSPSFFDPANKRIDENTIVKTTGPEAGIPHYYADEAEVRRLMARFEIIRLTHAEEVSSDYRSFHYFVLARK